MQVLLLLAFSFSLGAFVSYYVGKAMGYNAMIINCVLFVIIGIFYMGYIAGKYVCPCCG